MSDRVAHSMVTQMLFQVANLVVFALVFAVGLSSCDHQPILPPVPTVPGKAPISVVSVDPPTGYAGTMIKVTLQRQSDSIEYSFTYSLNGDKEYVWDIRRDSLWILFPYVSRYTGMYIHAVDNRTNSSYQLEVDFRPYPEVYPKPFFVTWWNNDWSIEGQYPGVQDLSSSKSIVNSGDTTALVLLFEGPDWEIHKKFVFLNRTGNQLPAFLEFVQYGFDYRLFNDTLCSGLVKLERWDPHGVVCGALFSSDTTKPRMKYFQEYFYFKAQ